ncbi:hypothetical protein V2A60_005405 [Cordyceps javanica]
MRENAELKKELQARLLAVEQDLVRNFGDFDFEVRLNTHFQRIYELATVKTAIEEDGEFYVELFQATGDARAEILKMEILGD